MHIHSQSDSLADVEASVILNVLGQVYATDEDAFLAGYLAASVSKTGTFGGTNIPTVIIFTDGFSRGVQRYKEEKGASVTVLGWDPSFAGKSAYQ